MKIYVLSADTYKRGCGSEVSLFGIYDSKNIVEKKGAELSKRGYYPNITEMELNKDAEEYIGGYFE